MTELYLPPALYVTWREPNSRRIFPVGRLLRLADESGTYEFCYVRGALEARERGFAPFIGFGQLDEVVCSRQLPPLFANRVMRTGRPDYASQVGRLGLSAPADPHCPRYLVDGLAQRLAEGPDARFTVLQVNPPPSPAHYRALCALRFRTKDGQPPFRSARLEPIADGATSLAGLRARRVA